MLMVFSKSKCRKCWKKPGKPIGKIGQKEAMKRVSAKEKTMLQMCKKHSTTKQLVRINKDLTILSSKLVRLNTRISRYLAKGMTKLREVKDKFKKKNLMKIKKPMFPIIDWGKCSIRIKKREKF